MRHPFLRCGGAFVPNDLALGDGAGPRARRAHHGAQHGRFQPRTAPHEAPHATVRGRDRVFMPPGAAASARLPLRAALRAAPSAARLRAN